MSTPMVSHHVARLGGDRDWSRYVVYCGGTRWDGNRYTDQHMAAHLSAYVPVLFVDPPVSARAAATDPVDAAARRAGFRLLDDGLACLTPPGFPGGQRPGIHSANQARVRRAIAASERLLGGRVAATVVASLDPLFGATGGIRLLFGTDDWVAGAELMGIPPRRLRRDERRLLRAADRVVAVSDALAAKWSSMGAEATVVTNGVDCDALAAVDKATWPAEVTLPPPIAGVVGHISDRLDLATLEAVAERGHSLLLVGPAALNFRHEHLASLLARPNVQWTGPKPFTELPSYLRAIDVGLTPYADTDFNRASFPLKTLEYLAAGRAAVTYDLPASRALGPDVVTTVASRREFVAAVGRALHEEATPARRAARRRVALAHDWSRKARAFADVLGVRGDRSPIPFVSPERPARP